MISPSIKEIANFNLEDFSQRWERARRASLRQFVSEAGDSETEALAKLPREHIDQVLRRVFDNSRAFGISFTKNFSVTWEVDDFFQLLPGLANPCLRGVWERRSHAAVVTRSGCEAVNRIGPRLCDYWREAFDGLVVGLGDEERFARHQSVGHGDPQCTDVIYLEHLKSDEASRFLPIPPLHQDAFDDIKSDFQSRFAMKVEFLGFSEGALYCRWTSDKHLTCGSSGKILWNYLTESVQKKFPGLEIVDTSPLAVLGNEA